MTLWNFTHRLKNIGDFWDVGNFYRCRLQILGNLGLVILPHLPTRVFCVSSESSDLLAKSPVTMTDFKKYWGFFGTPAIFTFTQGPLNGGVSNGGVSRSGLVLPFLSFFVLFLSFFVLSRGFPDLSGDSPGIFPIGPFPLSRPIKSTYEEQSWKGPRHNLDHSRKKWETPGYGNGNPPV